MPDGPHPDGPAGPGGRISPGWPAPVSADGRPTVLDLGFDSGTLHTVRAQMRACVSNAGFPEGQAEDVVLAVHELAANAVSHGGGAGRLRVWNLAGALYSQVDDGDVMASAGPGTGHDGRAVTGPEGSPDRASVHSLSRPGGSSVLVRFDRG